MTRPGTWSGMAPAWVGLALWLGLSGGVQAVEVRAASHLWLDDDTLLVRLDVNMDLPGVLADALINGVTLEFESEARLEQERWPGREVMASEARRVQLQYFALNRHYLVTAVTDQRMELKPTLGDALDVVARRLGRLPLSGLPDSVRSQPEDYQIAARLALVYSALPLPLQLDAGLRGELTARREWQRWPLD